MAVSLRSVALPAEHGGWSLTLEPALLGMLAAPSAAGWALAALALVAFLVRTPLKIALVDRHRRRRLKRTRLADRVAGAELVAATVLVVVAVTTAKQPFWWPLAAAAPLVAIELWYDIRSRSRHLVPELAGSVGVAAVAAAIALAAGADGLVAGGLWVVAGARAVAAVPFVRVQIRRVKNQAHREVTSDVAQLTAGVAAVTGYAIGAVPVAGTMAVVGLGVAHIALLRMPPPAIPALGAQQVALGLGVVLATALGVRAP